MFIAILTYKKPLSEVDNYLSAHREYLAKTLCHRRFHNIWATDPSHWWRDNDKSQQP